MQRYPHGFVLPRVWSLRNNAPLPARTRSDRASATVTAKSHLAQIGPRAGGYGVGITVPTSLFLERVFGNSADFWLNVQRRSDLWEAMHSPRERARIARARPLNAAA